MGKDSKKSKILRHILRKGVEKKITDGEFIPIPSRTLHSIVCNYRPLIKELISDDIITVNDHYSTDLNFCKEYRINPTCDTHKIALVITSDRFNGRFAIGRLGILKRHLLDLKIDEVDAKNVIDDLDGFNRKVRAWVNVMDLNRGNHFVTKDNFSGRVHSNVTTIKRELRPLITYRGNDTAIIDISSSHPFQQAVMHKNKPHLILKYLPKTVDQSRIIRDESTGLYFDDVMNGQLREEISKYLFNVDSRIQFQYKKRFNEDYDASNEVCVKRMVLKLMNDTNNTSLKTDVANRYPTVFETMEYLHSHYDNKKAAYAHLNQNIERELIVDKTTFAFASNQFIIPIHDAVLVRANKIDEVMCKIQNVYKSNLGIVPNMKIE